jgi:uncharacterized integral membrane protein
MKHIKAILIILFVLLVITVAVQNNSVMATKVSFGLNLLVFHHQTPPMSLYSVVIIAFLLGVLFMGFYGIAERFRLKKEIKTLTKESRGKDQELQSLRNLPVTAEGVTANQNHEVDRPQIDFGH